MVTPEAVRVVCVQDAQAGGWYKENKAWFDNAENFCRYLLDNTRIRWIGATLKFLTQALAPGYQQSATDPALEWDQAANVCHGELLGRQLKDGRSAFLVIPTQRMVKVLEREHKSRKRPACMVPLPALTLPRAAVLHSMRWKSDKYRSGLLELKALLVKGVVRMENGCGSVDALLNPPQSSEQQQQHDELKRPNSSVVASAAPVQVCLHCASIPVLISFAPRRMICSYCSCNSNTNNSCSSSSSNNSSSNRHCRSTLNCSSFSMRNRCRRWRNCKRYCCCKRSSHRRSDWPRLSIRFSHHKCSCNHSSYCNCNSWRNSSSCKNGIDSSNSSW